MKLPPTRRSANRYSNWRLPKRRLYQIALIRLLQPCWDRHLSSKHLSHLPPRVAATAPAQRQQQRWQRQHLRLPLKGVQTKTGLARRGQKSSQLARPLKRAASLTKEKPSPHKKRAQRRNQRPRTSRSQPPLQPERPPRNQWQRLWHQQRQPLSQILLTPSWSNCWHKQRTRQPIRWKRSICLPARDQT